MPKSFRLSKIPKHSFPRCIKIPRSSKNIQAKIQDLSNILEIYEDVLRFTKISRSSNIIQDFEDSLRFQDVDPFSKSLHPVFVLNHFPKHNFHFGWPLPFLRSQTLPVRICRQPPFPECSLFEFWNYETYKQNVRLNDLVFFFYLLRCSCNRCGGHSSNLLKFCNFPKIQSVTGSRK